MVVRIKQALQLDLICIEHMRAMGPVAERTYEAEKLGLGRFKKVCPCAVLTKHHDPAHRCAEAKRKLLLC